MTWVDAVYEYIDNHPMLIALATEMALLLDMPAVAPAAAPAKQGRITRPHAERQQRYRDRQRDASRSVTQSVTGVTNGVTRDASRAVVLSSNTEAEVVGSEGSSNSAARFLRNQNSEKSVTRDASPSVTNGVTVTDTVTRNAEYADLSQRLGPDGAARLRAFFKRHGIKPTAQHGYVSIALAVLKDASYQPADVIAACDDDEINPIEKGAQGFRIFVAAARDRRVRETPNTPKDSAALALQITEKRWGEIQARAAHSAYGDDWKDWCRRGAEINGLSSWAQYANLHFDDPWPPQEQS